MAEKFLLQTILVLFVIGEVRLQFFDIFQSIQPFLQTQRSVVPKITHDPSIRRPNKPLHEQTDYSFESISDSNERNQFPTPKTRSKQTTTTGVYLDYFTTARTTRKSLKHNSSHNTYSQSNKNVMQKYSNNDNNFNYQDLNSYSARPNDEIGADTYVRRTDNSQNDRYTTQRTLHSRPGVKPVRVDNRPPITNKPQTTHNNYWTTERTTRKLFWTTEFTSQRPVWTVSPEKPVWTTEKSNNRPFNDRTQKPTNTEGVITFPDDKSVTPEFVLGPDADYMSQSEKRRLVELSERMCDRYKALNTKQVQAIPLVPSPDPVEVNVTACTPITVPLVVGGKVVSIKQFPHMALLGWAKLDEEGYSWKCGGSLISDQFVLTAAHCAYQERDNSVTSGPPRAVQLGSSYLGDVRAKVIKIASVFKHPKYKAPKSYNDLAVVKMISRVTFSEWIKPACLGSPPREGEKIVATGWGRTEFGGDQSLDLRSVSLPVWSIEECSEVLGVSRKLPEGPSRDSQMCAGERSGGKDTCQGDSGGPAQIQDGCVWRVVAVTSLGRSCGAVQTPGLYATVQIPFISALVFGGKASNRIPDNNYSDTVRPTSSIDKLSSNNYRPAVNNRRPDINNRPHKDNVYRPGADDNKQSNNEFGASNNNYRPPNNKRPASNNRPQNNDDIYRPGANGNSQSNNAFGTLNNNYKPSNNNRPINNNRPENNDYKPASSIFRPDDNLYTPGANKYRPDDNYFRPSNSDYRPSSNNFKQTDKEYSNSYNTEINHSGNKAHKRRNNNLYSNGQNFDYEMDSHINNDNLYQNENYERRENKYNRYQGNSNERLIENNRKHATENYSFNNDRKELNSEYDDIDEANDPPIWTF